MVSGLKRWYSPLWRHWMYSSSSGSRMVRVGHLADAAPGSWAITSNPAPWIREGVPVKYRSTTTWLRPMASKILGSPVTFHGRDAHLGNDFQQSLAHRLDII